MVVAPAGEIGGLLAAGAGGLEDAAVWVLGVEGDALLFRARRRMTGSVACTGPSGAGPRGWAFSSFAFSSRMAALLALP